MPEKSVRDMNKWERLHYSLAARTFHAVIQMAIVLGAAALLVGLGLYTWALIGQYIGEAFSLCRTAAHITERNLDIAPHIEEVRSVYSSMSEEERMRLETDPDGYHAAFNHLKEDADYQRLLQLLQDFGESSDVNDVYVSLYDEATRRLVTVADPDQDPETACPPGYWEDMDWEDFQKFLDWDGQSELFMIYNTERYGWLSTCAYPIKDAEDGKLIGFFMADITLHEIWEGMKTFLLQYAVVLFVVVNLVAFLFTRRIKKTVVTPINEIAEAATNYVADKRRGVARTNHFAHLNISTGDEIENLALTMGDMEADLNDYESHLTRVTAEKERISTELSLANRIQADMLPNIYPAFPERNDFDVYATMDPAKEVGGDFYDFFLIDQDHLGLVMADVSGKGIPAALFMMVSKILMKNVALTGKGPAEVLATVNDQICANNREEMFVTVWFGVLDLNTGRLTAANAGHEFPVLKSPEGPYELVKDKHGFVIGGMPGMLYKEYELQLEPGSKLFLYTDGLPEATNAREELFGTERMLAALKKVENGTPCQVLKGMTAAVEAFVEEAPQFDDLTMLCLHYMGPQDATKEEGETVENAMKEITLMATVPNIERVTEFVNQELEAADCPLKTRMQIDVAIDEVFSNIAHYAYGEGEGEATVGLALSDTEPRTVTLRFRDRGVPYDPLKKADPNVSLSAEERELGGLGIFMVKKSMDDVRYEYKDGENVLTIKKHF